MSTLQKHYATKFHKNLNFSFPKNPHLQTWIKYLKQALVFMWNNAMREKVQFLFFSGFLVALTKFSFSE